MKRILCTAILLLLALACPTAQAAPTQRFDAFLRDEGLDPDAAETQAHVQLIDQAHTALDVTFSVQGVYFDGDVLLIGWRTEALPGQPPALVRHTRVTANGVTLSADADHPVAQWWPHVFGLSVAGDPINGLMGAFRVSDSQLDSLRGQVTFAVHATVQRPTLPLAVLDPAVHEAHADNPAMEADHQAMLAAMAACGVTVAPAEDTDIAPWQAAGYLVVNRHGQPYNALGLAPEDVWDTELAQDTADTQDVVITFDVNLDALAAGR